MKLDCQICCKAELANVRTEGLTLVDILYCANCGLIQVDMNKIQGRKK